MVQARDQQGHLVTPEMIDVVPEPFTRPLRCWFCTQQATTVEGYSRRNRKSGVTQVSSHFRLQHGEHDRTCPLHPVQIVEHVARDNQGLTEALPDGTVQLTLPETLDAEAAPPPSPNDPNLPATAPVAHSTTTVPPALPPALHSAVKIARLLRLAAHDTKAVAMFRVQYRRRTLAWTQFCYGPGESGLRRLHRMVAASKARQPLTHPVAVQATVRRTGTAGRGTAFAVLEGDLTHRDGTRVKVCLRSDYPSLLASVQQGTQVLAVGSGWKVWQRSGGTREVQLWLEAHWQLAYWRVDDQGWPGPPASPAPVPVSERHRRRTRPRTGNAPRPAARRRQESDASSDAGPVPNSTAAPRRQDGQARTDASHEPNPGPSFPPPPSSPPPLPPPPLPSYPPPPAAARMPPAGLARRVRAWLRQRSRR